MPYDMTHRNRINLIFVGRVVRDLSDCVNGPLGQAALKSRAVPQLHYFKNRARDITFLSSSRRPEVVRSSRMSTSDSIDWESMVKSSKPNRTMGKIKTSVSADKSRPNLSEEPAAT
jgi:hypothetical protein